MDQNPKQVNPLFGNKLPTASSPVPDYSKEQLAKQQAEADAIAAQIHALSNPTVVVFTLKDLFRTKPLRKFIALAGFQLILLGILSFYPNKVVLGLHFALALVALSAITAMPGNTRTRKIGKPAFLAFLAIWTIGIITPMISWADTLRADQKQQTIQAKTSQAKSLTGQQTKIKAKCGTKGLKIFDRQIAKYNKQTSAKTEAQRLQNVEQRTLDAYDTLIAIC